MHRQWYLMLILLCSVCLGAALKQDIASDVIIGPLVDYADGKTLIKNSLDVNDIECFVYRNESGYEKSLAGNLTLTGDGMATLSLDTDDVNTPGILRVVIDNNEPSGISTETLLPFTEYYTVYPANIYDSFYASDKLQVDLVQINGNASAAADLAKVYEQLINTWIYQ